MPEHQYITERSDCDLNPIFCEVLLIYTHNMFSSRNKKKLEKDTCKRGNGIKLLIHRTDFNLYKESSKVIFFILFTPGWSPAYFFEVVFVKCVCIWRTSVFFQFYGVLSGVIYDNSPPPPPHTHTFLLLLFKVTLLQQRTVLLVT